MLGCLPRTLEELRAGRERSELEEREREQAQRQRAAAAREQSQQETGPSLEETLDELFLSAENEENGSAQQSRALTSHTNRSVTAQPALRVSENGQGQNSNIPSNVQAQSMVPAGSRSREYQARRVAALRRELHRMRSGIERIIGGLRDLGEVVPDPTDASNRLSNLGRTLDTISGAPSRDDAQRAIDSVNALTASTPSTAAERGAANLQARVDEARRHADEAQRSRDQAASELDLADQELRTSRARLNQLRNEQRSTENYIRLFGSREEVVAQGENYESPIGGMFSRAMERFQVAESVRRDEQVLRQYLEDEERAGGEDASLLLASLEQQQRDVWGVPQSTQQSRTPINPTEITQTNYASGQTSRLAEASRSADQNYEAGLQQYYTLLRRQNWTQDRTDGPAERVGADVQNGFTAEVNSGGIGRFLRGSVYLNDLADSLQDVSRNLRDERSEATARAGANEASRTVVAGPPGEQLDTDPLTNNDRGLDAVFILSFLAENDDLYSTLSEYGINGSPETVRPIILGLLRASTDNSLTAEDRDNIQNIIQNETIIWGSGLPAERNRRRRARGERISFGTEARAMAEEGQPVLHDIEVMAEAYQMSVQIRRLSGLNASDQLRMLYRLQRGERDEATRSTLVAMLRSDSTQSRAREIHEQQASEMNPDQTTRHAALEHERREAARRGDHSRSELNAQRTATHSVALAAGQLAMRTSTATLIERMVNRDEETRAAYQRLQDNGFVPPQTMTTRRFRESTVYRPLTDDEDSEGESDGEGRGLDAPDTGRPQEAMTDEQMTVKLECQVCYSQMAIIAMLPCGHLTMCQWCSDQHSPTLAHDRTRPRRPAACPVCRKGIRQKVKVFRS